MGKDDKKLKIVHVVYGGFAGSPRGTLLLAEREKKIAEPFLMFIGGRKLNPEYRLWAERADIGFTHIKKSSFLDLRFIFTLPLGLFREKPKMIFVHGTNKFILVFWYKLFRPEVKMIVVEHGPGLHLEKSITSVSARLTNKIADGLIFVSQDIKEYWWNKYRKLPEFSKVISNGVDVDEFDGIKRRELCPGFKVISMVAVMSSQKDHVSLIRAIPILMEDIKNVKLILVGDGQTRPAIEEEIKRLGLSDVVEIRIFPPRKDVLEIIKSSDVYVLSTNGEGLSRSVLEAMAAKVPVVATDVSGNSGFIKDGLNGILTPPKDPKRLAEAIRSILKDDKLGKRLVDNAYIKLMKENTIDVAVASYIKFIDEQIKN